MNAAFEIAKKISLNKQKNYTRFVVRLSIIATALSVAAILFTFSIVNGFQSTISNKIYSFWGHIQITSISGTNLNDSPSQQLNLKSNSAIQSAFPFLNQTMVLAKDIEIEGLNAKGISDYTQIPGLSKGRNLQQGTNSIAREIVVSKGIATKLQIDTGDQVRLYFLQNGRVQERKLKVVGLFHTGIEDYDLQNVFVDIRLLQQLFETSNTITGYQVLLKDLTQIDQAIPEIQSTLPDNWVAGATSEIYPQLFDWIQVQSINRNITIIIMLFIAIVNLITCLLILLLERIPMIGTLTALGASHKMMRQIFMYQASFIAWTGIGLGVLIGIGGSLLQLKFGWIHLDESAYLIDVLPIEIKLFQVIWVILGTAIVSYISFLLPTIWIRKISPAKAVKFD